jgi:ATP-dependent Clp protease ATP-binding subunit ClpA
VEHAIKRPFPPEVCDRCSETLVFKPLGKKEIAFRELNAPRDQRQQERRIDVKVSPSAHAARRIGLLAACAGRSNTR